MNFEIIYFCVGALLGAVSADWMNLTKVRIQISYELPKENTLPPLGFVDRVLRNGTTELNGWFTVQLFLIPLIGFIFFQWYYLFVSLFVYFFGYIVAGLIFPEPFTDFYARRTIRSVRKFVLDRQKSETVIAQIERLSGLWTTEGGRRRLDRIWKGPLSYEERESASNLEVYLVWYDDRFERFSETASSFLHAVCLTREEAEKLVSRRPFHDEGNWDGYEMSGPSNLLKDFVDGFVSVEQVRQLLRGESPTGPKYN